MDFDSVEISYHIFTVEGQSAKEYGERLSAVYGVFPPSYATKKRCLEDIQYRRESLEYDFSLVDPQPAPRKKTLMQ